MTCEKGKCLVCETQISVPCKECGNSWKNLENYTHVQIPWSNGSKMEVAVCIPCSKDAVWKADKTQMTNAIWGAWDKIGSTYSKEIVLA